MRIAFCTMLAITLVGLGASSAFALDYADGASGTSYKASVTNLSDAANGSSETDDNVATITYSGGVSGGDGRADITFDFPTWNLAAGDHFVWLVVDGDITGTIWAQVRSINGTDNISVKNKSISGTNLQDQLFGLTFSLSSDTQITSIKIRIQVFDVGGSGASISLDAVATPEPGTFLLFGLGALGLGVWSRRRTRMKKKV